MDPIPPIIEAIDSFIRRVPETSEHALIKHLQTTGIAPFPDFDLKHQQSLFHAHFLLKHCLYLLQEQACSRQDYVLSINTTRVTCQPFSTGTPALQKHDPVREYYLNLDHYFETTEEAVNDMLTSFWQRYLSYHHQPTALATLGLKEGASHQDVKVAFKRLAQQHHPDKGGDAEQFKAICDAKVQLDRIHKS